MPLNIKAMKNLKHTLFLRQQLLAVSALGGAKDLTFSSMVYASHPFNSFSFIKHKAPG